MHGYAKQIAIRWTCAVLALLLLGACLGLCADKAPQLLSENGIRSVLAEMAVSLEYSPFWVWFAIFLAITAALYIGTPSVICFSALFIFTDFFVAFSVVFLCQVFVMRLAVRRALKKVFRPEFQNSLGAELTAKLLETQPFGLSFAFWARLYISYPLRSIDELTPLASPKESSLAKILASASAAIFIRTLITSVWAFSLVSLVKSAGFALQSSINLFLTMSSVIVVYALLPKIPEFFICPLRVKKILYLIDKTAFYTENGAPLKAAAA